MAKSQGLILWQLPMKRVLYGLLPAVAASVYFFGWRSLLVLAVVNAAGFLTEFLFLRLGGRRQEPVSSAVFVTNFILALSLPPTIPYWMAALGAVIGVLFGKMVFGGFGRNPFNPAMVGRAFLYVSFGAHMTARWAQPFWAFPGGLTRLAADAATGASPLAAAAAAAGPNPSWLRLLLGGTYGSFGETSAVLLLLGGLYIVWKKAASYQIVLGGLAGFLVPQSIFWLAGVAGAPDPLTALLAGSFLFGLLFIVTEPVSCSQTTTRGRWIYGAAWGLVVVLIRSFSAWPEGVMFAVLFVNMFAPILDYLLKQGAQRKAVK